MRLTKTFGLAVVAAIAAMAFVGAGSAIATSTQLCKVHTEPCPAGSAAGMIHLVSTNIVMHMVFFGITNLWTCTSSLEEGTILGLAAPQVGHLTSLSFTGCTHNGERCGVTTTALGLLKILKTALNLGEVNTEGTTARVECPGLPTCEYGGSVKLGTAEGALHTLSAGHGLIVLNATLVVTGGGFCPTTARWEASYESLEHLYIVA